MTRSSSCFTIPGPRCCCHWPHPQAPRFCLPSPQCFPLAGLLTTLTLLGPSGFTQSRFNTPTATLGCSTRAGSLAARKESRFGITSSVCLLGPVVCAAEVDELRTSGTPNHTPHHFTLGETEARRKGDSSKVQSYSGSKAGCSPPPPLQPPQDTLYTVELPKHV